MEAKRLTLPMVPRREEEALIRQALKEVREGGVRVIFLGGSSGVGKSTLIREALSGSTTTSCWHADTKFDQRKPNAPLENLRAILSNLVETTIQKEQTLCPQALKSTLDKRQYHVLKDFLTGSVTAELPDEEDCSEEFKSGEFRDDDSVVTQSAEVSKDALSVLTSTFKACIRSIAKLSTVILTMDDIHWSCQTTMHILKTVLMDPSLTNVLVCGTFRTDEDSATEGFYDWKEQLADELTQSTPSATVQTMLLDDLTLPQVSVLLADALSKDTEAVTDLANIVFGFTHGNLFFMKHFLEKLQDDELLIFDLQSFQWQYNVEHIKRRSSLSDNVVQTLASRLHKLPLQVQNVLMLAACFGARFDIRALDVARSALDVNCVYYGVGEALKGEFVIQLNETHYRFSHDMIQLAAYGLLPEDIEVSEVHWKIGSLLVQEEELLKDDSTFFATVDHLNLGADSGMEGCEHEKKCKLAKLNYKAGKKASNLSSFVPAARYFEAGMAFLGDKPFGSCYELAVKLYSALASTEYVVGNIEHALEATQHVLEHAKTCDEKIPMLIVMFDCYMAQNRITELLEFCFHKLTDLGIKLPRKPNSVHVQLEYQKMKTKLKAMSNEDILALPVMTDPSQLMALQILYRMSMPLYHAEEQGLSVLIVSLMINMTLKDGLAKDSAQVFVYAAAFIAGQSHDIREASRLGQLAERMYILFGKGTSSISAMSLLPFVTKWWLEPATNCLETCVQIEKTAMKRGLVANAFQCNAGYSVNYFYTGLALGPLLDDVEKHCNRFLEYNQVGFFFLLSPLWQFLLNLTGKSENPASLEEGEIIDRRNALANTHKKTGEQTLQSYQMILSFYLGDLPKATKMLEKVLLTKPGLMKASFWYCSRRMIFGLVAIANYRLTKRRKDKAEADKELKFFRAVVKEGAINLVHKLQLLEAEMLAVTYAASFTTSRPSADAVLAKYDEAMVSASRIGQLQDAALANYLCFQFIKAQQVRVHMAELYLKRSFELWMSWGAVAVASSLVDRHTDMFDSVSARNSIRSLKGSANSGSSNGLRSRPRFDAQLSNQHKELNVMI